MGAIHFPCRACGATLEFAPGSAKLGCPYCGAANDIPEADAAVQAQASGELDYRQWVEKARDDVAKLAAQSVKCGGCGASTEFGPNVVADVCAFCAKPMIAEHAYAQRTIQPQLVVPFAIPRQQGVDLFRRWLQGLWFAPNALKRQARQEGGLKGVYVPYWTYDCATVNQYRGERGDDYYETESWVDNGVSKTRQVKKTRWTPVQGVVPCAFNDVLVVASAQMPRDDVEGLAPWQLDQAKPCRSEFLSGFTAEAWGVRLEDGFVRAQQLMAPQIDAAIRGAIGGDQQRIGHKQTDYQNITFKHLLLPLWLAQYRYQNTVYRFMINGQTGKVHGDRPWSAWKIGGAVLGGLLLIGGLFWLMS